MTIAGWITMIFVTGIVWGGLAILLPYAIGKERKKGDHEPPETIPTP